MVIFLLSLMVLLVIQIILVNLGLEPFIVRFKTLAVEQSET